MSHVSGNQSESRRILHRTGRVPAAVPEPCAGIRGTVRGLQKAHPRQRRADRRRHRHDEGAGDGGGGQVPRGGRRPRLFCPF